MHASPAPLLLPFLLLFLLLGAVACQPPLDPPAPPTPLVCPSVPAPGIRITTYNTFLNVDAPGHPSSEDAYMTPPDWTTFEGGQAQRARVIAQLILEDPPDVIVFNEANDDAARDALVDELKGLYVARVLELDEHDTDNDSGLMLFSRHPFLPLDQAFELPDDDFFVAFNNFQPFDVNWWVYPSSMTNGGDDWMNRGAAMVRIANTCDNNRPFSIVFTHTQSSSPEDKFCEWGEDVEDRNQQMRHIRELIEFSINSDGRSFEPIYVVGDLNVEGNQLGANVVSVQNRPAYMAGEDGEPCLGPKPFNEWQLNFDSRGPVGDIAEDLSDGFFSCRGNQPTTAPCDYDGESGTFLIDSWAYESSAEDPGQTNSGHDTGGPLVFTGPDNGERLDYILHNRPVNRETEAELLCMQHIRRGFPIAGPVAYSDHLPLSADFNRPAPRCSVRPRQPGDPLLLDGDDPNPLGPERVFFDVEDPSASNYKEIVHTADSDPATGIAFPGSVQWYVIDQPYPYRIKVEPAGGPQATVAYEVYQARDLSNPERAYEGECIPADRSRECLYLLSDPPYYVKVFAATNANPHEPDRAQTGGYAITFRRYDCSTPEEACPLEPGKRSPPFLWPANQRSTPAPRPTPCGSASSIAFPTASRTLPLPSRCTTSPIRSASTTSRSTSSPSATPGRAATSSPSCPSTPRRPPTGRASRPRARPPSRCGAASRTLPTTPFPGSKAEFPRPISSPSPATPTTSPSRATPGPSSRPSSPTSVPPSSTASRSGPGSATTTSRRASSSAAPQRRFTSSAT